MALVFAILYLTEREKRKKYLRALDLLRFLARYKRISKDEYKAAVGEYPPDDKKSPVTPIEKNNPVTSTISQPVAQPLNRAAETISEKSTTASESPDRGIQRKAEDKNTPIEKISISDKSVNSHPVPVAPKPKTKLRPNFALNVMLIIGVVFVILAGVLFATTQWIYLPPYLRTLVICSVSVVFFLASFVTDKILKIKKTAVSFYTIGAFFLPTAVLTVGYFGMLGTFMSLQGEGRFFLFSIAFFLLGLSALIGSLKYKLTYFTECFLYCVTGTVIFLVAAFRLSSGLFILVLYIYAGLLILLGIKARKIRVRESRFTHIIARIPLFTILNSLLITSAGFFVPGVDVSIGIASVLLSPLFLTTLFRGKNSYAGVFPFAFVLTAGMLRFGYGGELAHFLLLALLSATLITIVGCITVLPEGMRKVLRIISTSLAALLFVVQFFSLINSGSWNGLMLALVVGVAVNIVFMSYIEENRVLLSLAVIPAITALHGVASLLSAFFLPTGLLFSVLLTILFFVILILDRKLAFSPRSIASDCLIMVCLFAVGLVDLLNATKDLTANRALIVGSLITFVLLFSILWVEAMSHKNKVISCASAVGIPFLFYLMYIPVQLLLPDQMSWAPLYTAFYAAFAAGGLLLRYKAISDRRFRIIDYSAMGLFFSLQPVIYLLWGVAGVLEVPILLLIVTVYLTGYLLIRSKYSASSSGNVIHQIVSFLWGASLFSALTAISQFWFGTQAVSVRFVFPAAAAILLVVISSVLRKRGVSFPAFSYLLRVSSVGLTVLTALSAITFQDRVPLEFAVPVYIFLAASFVSQYLAGHAFILSWIEPVILFGFTNYLIRRADLDNNHLVTSLIFSGLFLVLVVLGRVLHKRIFESISDKNGDKVYRLDWLTLSSVLAPCILIQGDNVSRFLSCVLFALYSLSFARRTGDEFHTRLSVSFAAAFVSLAIWLEPFFSLPDAWRLKLNLLIFIMYFVILRYVIWKNKVRFHLLFQSLSMNISFIILAFSSVESNSISYGSALAVGAILSFFSCFSGYMLISYRKDSKRLMELATGFFTASWGFTGYSTVFILTYDVLSIYSLYTNALILSVLSAAVLLTGFIVGKQSPSRREFFDRIVKIGSFGLMLFSAFMVIFYSEAASLLVAVSALFLLVSHIGQHISGHAFASSWLEPVLMLALMTQWADRLEGIDHQIVKIVVYTLMFFVTLSAGHLLHKRIYSRVPQSDSKNRYSIDWLSISAVLSAGFLLFCGKWGIFISFLLVAVSMVSFRIRSIGEITRSVFASVAAAFVVFALWAQPLIDLPEIIIAEWYLLLVIAYFLFLRRAVWKGREKVCEILLFTSTILSIIILSISAINSGELFDALFMGIGMFILMCVSFITRKKKWFVLSSVTVVCLSIYLTRSFWSSIAWWIYLLATGLIIIGLAASNEIMKQKGDSLTGRARSLFKDWE